MKEDVLKIINHYGVMPQLKYFQSEVFELNEAIIDAEHNRYIGIVREPCESCIKHIAEEIADVIVMLYQFQEYYNISDDEIDEIMIEKIDRQLDRIKSEVNNEICKYKKRL